MKQTLTRLSQRYVAALQKHLRQGPRASLRPAHDLGCQAAALDLETLDVARIHEGALAALEASSSEDGFIKRADDAMYRAKKMGGNQVFVFPTGNEGEEGGG